MSSSDINAPSSRTMTFVTVFSIVMPVLYVLCDFRGWALFTYHPAVNLIEFGQTPPRSGLGPVMYWYGWLMTTLIGSTAVALLATLLPQSVAKKIPLALAWLLPLVAVPLLIYSLMPWWTR